MFNVTMNICLILIQLFQFLKIAPIIIFQLIELKWFGFILIIYIFFQAKLLPQEPPRKNEKVKALPYYFDDGNYSTMLYIDLFVSFDYLFFKMCALPF